MMRSLSAVLSLALIAPPPCLAQFARSAAVPAARFVPAGAFGAAPAPRLSGASASLSLPTPLALPAAAPLPRLAEPQAAPTALRVAAQVRAVARDVAADIRSIKEGEPSPGAARGAAERVFSRLIGETAAVRPEVPVSLDAAQAAEAGRLEGARLKGSEEARALAELRGMGIPVESATYLPSEKRHDSDPDSLRWPRWYRTSPRLIVRFADAETALKFKDKLPLRVGSASLRTEAPRSPSTPAAPRRWVDGTAVRSLIITAGALAGIAAFGAAGAWHPLLYMAASVGAIVGGVGLWLAADEKSRRGEWPAWVTRSGLDQLLIAAALALSAAGYTGGATPVAMWLWGLPAAHSIAFISTITGAMGGLLLGLKAPVRPDRGFPRARDELLPIAGGMLAGALLGYGLGLLAVSALGISAAIIPGLVAAGGRGMPALRTWVSGALSGVEEQAQRLAEEARENPKTITTARYASFMAQAAKLYFNARKPHAPDFETYETAVEVQAQLQRIFEAAAGKIPTLIRLKRDNDVLTGVGRILEAVQHAPTAEAVRTKAREAADIAVAELGRR